MTGSGPVRETLTAWLVEIGGADTNRLSAAWPDPGAIARVLPAADVGSSASEIRRKAHFAVRVLLARRLGTIAAAQPFVVAPGGKPALPGACCSFSLAHSGERALVAISTQSEVGVDLERPRRLLFSAERRQRLIAAAIAAAGGLSLPTASDDAALLQAWVRLEAMSKATGEGLHRLLTRYGVMGVGAGRTLGALDTGAERFRIHDLVLDEPGRGYVAAIAASPELTIEHRPRAFPDTVDGVARLLAGGA